MDRRKWILAYMKEHGPVDVLNSPFVDAYKEATKARFIPMWIGADRVPGLGELLGKMYREGLLIRGTVGISMEYGWPKWVYVYQLKEDHVGARTSSCTRGAGVGRITEKKSSTSSLLRPIIESAVSLSGRRVL